MKGWYILNRDRPYIPTTQALCADPLVDGLSLRASWQELEPTKGEYNWSLFDTDIALAKAAGKTVMLRAYICFRGYGAPNWVYQAGARWFAYDDPAWGNETSELMVMPIPWDEIFLEKWTAFIAALGVKYNYDSSVVLVQIAGPGYTGGEMHLPRSSEDIIHWEEIGYGKKKLVDSWKKVIDAYSKAFPSTLLALNVSRPLYLDGVVEAVLAYAVKKLTFRLCVQHNGLAAKTVETTYPHSWVTSSIGKATIGFQQLCPVTPRGAFNDDGRRYGGTLETSLQIGLRAKMQYLEVYQPDIDNSELRPIFAAYSRHLR